MFRPAFLTLALFCSLACAAQPSFAARHDAGAFSAELPDGWTMTKEDELTRFAAPDGSVELTVILKKYKKPEVNEIVAEWVGQTPVKMLTPNSYIYEDSSESRGWGMIAEDGTFVDISVTEAYDGITAFIAGLKANDGERGLAAIFTAAASSEAAAEWLLFAVPPFAEQDGDGAEGTPYEHKTFTAIIPEGWTASDQGESVLFASDAEDAFVMVRIFTLEPEDSQAFAAWGKEQAKAFGGKNVFAMEGRVEFTTDKGASGTFNHFGNKCLFLLIGGESPKFELLVRSIDMTE